MPRLTDQKTDLLTTIMQLTEELSRMQDLDATLDQVLYHARAFTNADAGSIFLVKDGNLRFSYVHNDTLFGADASRKYIYSDVDIPINESSMAGYVAQTGQALLIDDAYHLPPELPFSFNPAFDRESGYRTTSMLGVPLQTSRGKVVGVLQIINAQDEAKNSIAFDEQDRQFANHFGLTAAVAIERAIITRELILRTIRMAELRDPKETGAHVNRVGAYAAEIYEQWAKNRGLDADTIKRDKDLMRLAAMLHDVGKVAISDAILKKPGRLTEQEFGAMKWHTVFGARLFVNATSEMDRMASEIALTHHAKWNGKGYPGPNADINSDSTDMGPPSLAGENIPINGRITALADVYDALISARVYKDAWPEERALEIIDQERGQHFDPEVVDAFMAIQDIIKAIREKYRDEEEEA